jgi:hypothetical protein
MTMMLILGGVLCGGIQPGLFERRCACLGDGLVLLAGSTADSDTAYYFAAALQRDPSREDYDPPVIRCVNSEELLAGLAIVAEVFCLNIKSSRRPRFVDRNVYTADPSSVHTNVCNQVPAFIHNRYVHRLSDGLCFFFSGCYHLSCVI